MLPWFTKVPGNEKLSICVRSGLGRAVERVTLHVRRPCSLHQNDLLCAASNLCVWGSPGVGKSAWQLFLVWKLVQAGHVLVLEWETFRGMRILLQGGEVVWGDSEEDFMGELWDVNTFYLVDGLLPTSASARTVLTCCPLNDVDWDIARRIVMRRIVMLKVMPPWTYSELRRARGLYPHVPEHTVSSSFDMWGGDANRVLKEANQGANTSFAEGSEPDMSAVQHAMRTFAIGRVKGQRCHCRCLQMRS